MPDSILTSKPPTVCQLLVLLCLTLITPEVLAASPKTDCPALLDSVIGRFLSQPNFISPKDMGRVRQENSPIAQSVCQRYPGKQHLWQAAYVLDRHASSKPDPSFDLVVALVDAQLKQVVAITETVLEPDAMYDEKSPLSFAPPLGLTGLDMQLLRSPGSHGAKCPEGFLDKESTVYVVRRKKLVPVISNIFLLHEWHKGGCVLEERITVQETQRSLKKAAGIRHGMPNVHLNIKVRDFNEKTGKLYQTRRTKFLLRYNGQQYESAEELSKLEECWLNPSKIFCKKPPTQTK